MSHFREPASARQSVTFNKAGLAQRLESLVSLLSDWYWEQDADFRYTLVIPSRATEQPYDSRPYLGKTLWEIGAMPLNSEHSWSQFRGQMAEHKPFAHVLIKYVDPTTGLIRYISNTGEPTFDSTGAFCGYRGVSTDVTAYIRDQELLTLEHKITQCLTLESDVMLGEIIQLFCKMELWTCGAFWQLTDAVPQLKAFGTLGRTPDPFRNYFVQTRACRKLAVLQEIYKSRQVEWIADTHADARISVDDGVADISLRSAVFFPVISNGKVLGIFNFASRTVRQPDTRLLDTIGGISAQISQVLQRREAEQILRESEERFRSLVELSSDWYWRNDINHRLVEIRGRGPDNGDDLIGQSLWDDDSYEILTGSREEHRAILDAQLPFRELIIRSKKKSQGLRRYASISGEPIFGVSGEFLGYRGVARDISESKRDEERIHYLATHDSLTGLVNRSSFSATLHTVVRAAERYPHKFAVLFIDLDRFKTINDTLGHEAGDTLLKEVALRLQHTIRDTDTVARLGGDEFVILIQHIERDDDTLKIARKILATLSQSILIQGQEYRVTASIGISRFPEDTRDEHALMKNADIAMYRAKEEGKNNCQFYSESIKSHSLERLALETSLRLALERNEFVLHYQAKRDLLTRRITGVEALLRWQHPDLGMVSPVQFIPLAEETGLIVPIGRWVIETACAQNRAWQQAGLTPVRMAVNLSARQFFDPDLLNDISAALVASKLDPQWLELELTESMVMQDHERTIQILTSIKQLGIRLAIDDFGTGYSSLAQLKRFPIDTLKVDRAFIRDLPDNVEDRAITKAIIAMGRTLSMTVVAEGVETEAQEDFLREQSCDETQGFYFSKPIPPEEFATLLDAHS
jgi:diguanylate cyclase (GGDEF)-like protein/PAS domain S-box-containing protein